MLLSAALMSSVLLVGDALGKLLAPLASSPGKTTILQEKEVLPLL